MKAKSDTLTSAAQLIELDQIENEAMGGRGADTIIGNFKPNQLQGLAGNDRIEGFDGNDTLDGGEGVDILLGGEDAYEAFLHGGLDRVLDAIVTCTRGNACVADVLLTCFLPSSR
jgi:Ca2+-binding RTX toxin-like protein